MNDRMGPDPGEAALSGSSPDHQSEVTIVPSGGESQPLLHHLGSIR